MSSRSTIWPSLRQTYCCRRREPQSLCSRLNEICPVDCVAVKSLTGIATSPNEIVSEPIERGAAMSSASFHLGGLLEPDAAKGLRQALLFRNDIMPSVAGAV